MLYSEGILEYMLTYPPEYECGKVNNNSDSGPTFKSTGTNTTRSDRPRGKKRSRVGSSRRNLPPTQCSRREEADSQAGPSNTQPSRPPSSSQDPIQPSRRDSLGSRGSRDSQDSRGSGGSGGNRNPRGHNRHQEDRQRERTPLWERRCRNCNCIANNHARYCYKCASPLDGGRR